MIYPIGTQTFSILRERGMVYVDKTRLVYELVKKSRVVFLSRPRRFGKSLLLSTIEAYYEGREDLFKGLDMEKLEKDWLKHPVFHVDFNGEDYCGGDTLALKIEGLLKRWENVYGEDPNCETTGDRFTSILIKAYEKTGQKPVVLIDEYDKPLLDVMGTDRHITINGERITLEERNRDLLKGFYSTLKGGDKLLTFAMLTGVTKFSQVSVFSGFNQPDDISMQEKYEAICGISEEELYNQFEEPIKELAAANDYTVAQTKAELKKQYDGYHFSVKMKDIYNPFSILNCFNQNQFRNFWFATGNPTYLVRLLNSATVDIKKILDEEYEEDQFVNYKANKAAPLPMIYQSGYLTIKEYDREFKTFKLDFPNTEVRKGFVSLLASNYFAVDEDDIRSATLKMVKALKVADIERFMDVTTAYMAEIPYTMRRGNSPKEYERFFHLIFYLTLRLVSSYTVFTEKQQSHGRCDCIIETEKFVYIIEFKLDGTANEALQQIEDKGYALPYKADDRQLFKLGVVFSSETGTIVEYKRGENN